MTIDSKFFSGGANITNGELARLVNEGTAVGETKAALDLYVSDVNGDDANDGLSPATALKSYDPVDSLVPSSVKHLTKIHTGRHGGAGYALPTSFRQRLLNHGVYLVGDGAGQAGEDGFVELLAPGTADGSSTTKKLVTSGLTPNEFRRRTVIILDGAAAGDRRSIAGHDATDITPAKPFSASVANASFRIVKSDIRVDLAARPEGSIIYCSDDTQLASGLAGVRNLPRVGFVNLAFEGFGFFQTIGASVFFGCDFDLDSFSFPMFDGPVLGGIDTSDLSVAVGAPTASEDFPLEAPGDFSWAGWCITGKGDSSLGSLFMTGPPFVGFLVVPGFFGGGTIPTQIFGGSLFGGPGSASRGALGMFQGTVILGQTPGTEIPLEVRNDGGPAIEVSLFADLSVGVSDVLIKNADVIAGGTGDGVVVGGRGIVRHHQGSINAGRYGYNSVGGGRVAFDNGVTITATTAETTVNTGSVVKAKAAYASVGDILIDVPNDGSIVQRMG